MAEQYARTPQRRERASLYDWEWRRYSKRRLELHPWCVRCAARGLTRPAVVTDHITPHRGNVALFNDPENHQSLCKRCHDRKTRLEDGGFGTAGTIAKPARHASSDPTTTLRSAHDEHHAANQEGPGRPHESDAE